MFKKIAQEKCAIETQKINKALELQNKEKRAEILEFLSNILGEQWKDIKYKECEEHIEIEYEGYNIKFHEYFSWNFDNTASHYSANYKCPACHYNSSEIRIYGACDIVSIIEDIDIHKCEIKKPPFSFLRRK